MSALGELIPKEERAKITSRRRSETAKRNLENLGEEGFKIHQSAAAKARQLKNPVNMEDLMKAKGIIPWTEHERHFALFLITQPEYQYKDGTSYKGLPILSKIADALNCSFHSANPVRDKNSIRGFLNGYRKKSRIANSTRNI